MTGSIYTRTALAVLSAFVGASSLMAQSSQVSGHVLDASKASLSAAKVILLRSDTGDRRETTTSSEGYYSFPALLPGSYQIEVQKESFASESRNNLVVQTGQISTVDFELAVGSVSESVNVEEQSPLLETATSSVSNVVENKTIVNMPLIDRRSSQLQRLSGFVVQNGTGSGATFAIAGGRGNNANYLIDGGTAQNLLIGVPTLSFDPPIESVQEFNVSISNYAAELGRTGGGVIQMTTKSGSNNFHGSAYEFFRNDVLNSRTFFSATKPTLRYNLFGASLGGPIRKNKTQFFFNYEGRRQANATTVVQNVPGDAEKLGDFSASGTRVIDPLTQQQFPGNRIPVNRLDPVGRQLASFYPTPNVPGAAPGRANFVANNSAYTPVDAYVARIDHAISERDRIFGRFLAQTDNTRTDSVYPVAGTDSLGNLSHNYYYNASGTWFHNFSPTIINEARYTYTRRQALAISAGVGTGLAGQIGLQGVNPDFFPTVTVNGYAQLGNNQQQRLQSPIRSDQYADNVTIVRGRHQIKFGGEYRYASNLDVYSPTGAGAFNFNNLATGSSLASLLLGYVNQASLNETFPLLTRADSYGAFIQDDWRVTSKLTLNIGLRYDLDSPRRETQNRQIGFDANAINPISGTPGVITFSGLNSRSSYAHRWDSNNFGPRIGFAWNAAQNWVVRGGGAILFLPEYDQATPIVASTGFARQANYVSPDAGRSPAFLLGSGFPATASPTTADLTPGFGAVPVGQRPTTSIGFFNPNRINGYLYQASLDIQRQLSGNLLIDFGYLGTFGHHLPAPDAQSVNQIAPSGLAAGNAQSRRPFPQYSNVSVIAADIGNSNYHALNIGVEKRYSQGLQFKVNYTFAKSIDDLSSRNELAGYPGVNTFTNYYNQSSNRGRSGNDIRHRFIGSTVYELPFGQGRRFGIGSNVLNAIAGGWSVGAIAELRTGTALSPIELTNNTNSFSDGVRPNVVGSPSVGGDRSKDEQLLAWFNTSAFVAPANYTFGNAGRTFGSGPGAVNVDTSLMKDLRIHESTVLQIRAEGLNVLNRANFANPDTRRGSPTFGQVTSLVSGNQARIIQLGLQLRF